MPVGPGPGPLDMRQLCFCSTMAVASTVAVAAVLLGLGRPSAQPASHPLQPVRRVREVDLTPQAFALEFVETRTPVVVELAGPSDAQRRSALEQALTSEECGRQPVSLMSSVDRQLFDEAGWLTYLGLSLVLRLAGAGGAAEHVERSTLPLEQFAARVQGSRPGERPFARSAALLDALSFPRLAGALRSAGAHIEASRLYLHDVKPGEPGFTLPRDCVDGLRVAIKGLGATPSHASAFDAELLRSGPETLAGIDLSPTRLFYGATGTASYTLHQDVAHGDLFFRVVSGAKRFAIFPAPTEETLLALRPLSRMPYPLNHSFAYDPFASLPPDAETETGGAAPVAGGLVVTLRPHEVLYVPGEAIHTVQNVGRSPTLGLCSRPFLHLPSFVSPGVNVTELARALGAAHIRGRPLASSPSRECDGHLFRRAADGGRPLAGAVRCARRGAACRDAGLSPLHVHELWLGGGRRPKAAGAGAGSERRAPLPTDVRRGRARLSGGRLWGEGAGAPSSRPSRRRGASRRDASTTRPRLCPRSGLISPKSPHISPQAAVGSDERGLLSGLDVVEVGCGRGGGAAFLFSRHAPSSLTGVDAAPQQIEQARRRFGAQGEALQFRVGAADSLPVEDGSADLLLSVESMHTYTDKAAFLREARRVLRPGGALARRPRVRSSWAAQAILGYSRL